VTGKRRDLVHRRVLPDADLVLDRTCRVAVGGDDLVGGFGPEEVADLSERRGKGASERSEGREEEGREKGGGRERRVSFEGFRRG